MYPYNFIGDEMAAVISSEPVLVDDLIEVVLYKTTILQFGKKSYVHTAVDYDSVVKRYNKDSLFVGKLVGGLHGYWNDKL